MAVARVLGRQAGAALGAPGHDLELGQHTTSVHKVRLLCKWLRSLRLQVDGILVTPILGRSERHLRNTPAVQSHMDGGHRPRVASRLHTVLGRPRTLRRRQLP